MVEAATTSFALAHRNLPPTMNRDEPDTKPHVALTYPNHA